AVQTPGRKHRLAEKMLDLRSELHQFRGGRHRSPRVLSRSQIRDNVGYSPVVLRGQQPLGTHQIVVQKLCVGKGAADIYEEFQHLRVIQRAPAWQRDLKNAESDFVGEGDLFANRRGRESNHADLRKDVLAGRLLTEDFDDTLKSGIVDRITFPGGTEDVQVVEASCQKLADLLPEQVFDEMFLVVPRN